MNVKLAYHTISASVASAINFLREDMKSEESEATRMFIKTFDKIFHLCYSSSPFGKGYKSPITVGNLKVKEQNVKEAVEYIKGLKDLSGRLLLSEKRKTGFIDFLCSLKSTTEVSKMLLSMHKCRNVLTHRFSLDHPDTFFQQIRRHHRWINNPSPLQFKWALMALLLKKGVLPSSKARSRKHTHWRRGRTYIIWWQSNIETWSFKLCPLQENAISMHFVTSAATWQGQWLGE